MNDVIFYLSLYFGLGVTIGILHLWRCSRCSDRFAGFRNKLVYIGIAALVQLPISTWFIITGFLESCEDEEANDG